MDQEVYKSALDTTHIQVQGEEREQELHHFMEMLNKRG